MEQSLVNVADAEVSERPLAAPTVCEAFQRAAALYADRPALRTLDGSLDLTWAELAARVERLAAGLAGLGIRAGDTVAMLLPNVPECHLVDYAAIHLGAVPFTIYNTSTAEQVRHQLTNADARVIVTQEAFLEKVDAALPLPTEAVISFLPMAHAGGRITAHYMALAYGACITACPDLKELPTYLAQVHPDAVFTVPRLWEKFQVAVEGLVASMEGEDGARAARALEVGLERVKALDGGTDVAHERADDLAAKHEAALPALEPVLARLGLD